VLATLALGACGFHPLYSEETTVEDEPALASVQVATIAERLGQQLAWSLREALNPRGLSVKPRYTLFTTLLQTQVHLGIQRNPTATRGRVDVYATISLTDIGTGKRLYYGHVQSTAAFNFLQDAYSAQVAQDDARTRTVRDLTTEIRTRIALVLREQKKTASEK